jgi:hypothetical protein
MEQRSDLLPNFKLNGDMKTKYLFGIVALLYFGCTETEFDKVTLPTTDVSGEYVVT